MSEKEKMLNEDFYNSYDAELLNDRDYVKDLCFEFNNLKPSDRKVREDLFKKIVSKVGNNSFIEQPFMCDYGYNITIGNNFYSNHNLIILDPGKVIIGNNVMIGPNCSIYTAYHPIDKKLRLKGEFCKSIHIGNDVWIGGNVVILPGVSIGDGSVIRAGSVVTKDIPSGVVAYGNPCRVVDKYKKI